VLIKTANNETEDVKAATLFPHSHEGNQKLGEYNGYDLVYTGNS
jgi:hypothetical protein